MGIWTNLLVAPREARLLTHDEFGKLLHDLFWNNIVQMPCVLLSCASLSAKLSVVPFLWEYDFVQTRAINGEPMTVPGDYPPGTKLDFGGVIHYCGQDVEELLQALGSAPYGIRDLCAWFHGLNSEVNSSGNYADVIVYALTDPDKLIFYEVDGWRMEDHELAQEEMDEDEKEELDERGIPKNATQIHTHVVQSCFRTTGKSGPFETCPPMDVIFERSFGKDFIVDCSSH
jgi:hypothetical protein